MEMILSDSEKTDLGMIEIAPEVLATIAGMATLEVNGVAGMSGGITSEISEWLGRKNLAKGVKVDIGQREAKIEVSILIQYGKKIPEIAIEVQRNVAYLIESMTGLQVTEVNVHIFDIHFSTEKADDNEDARVR